MADSDCGTIAVASVTTFIEEVDGVRSIVPASKLAVDKSGAGLSVFFRRRSPRSDFSAKVIPLFYYCSKSRQAGPFLAQVYSLLRFDNENQVT
jgi:hypothetical protein